MDTTRILVTGDNPEILSTVRTVLQTGGDFTVFTANDNQTALCLLQEIAPDLVILDIRMIETEGIRLPLGIRQVFPVPIMILSSSGGVKATAKGRGNGGNSHLHQNSSSATLISRIQTLLGKAGFRLTPMSVIL